MEVKEFLYVPGLEKNLLFVSAMENKGLEAILKGGEVVVRMKRVYSSMR
jgi:hypothetical protein